MFIDNKYFQNIFPFLLLLLSIFFCNSAMASDDTLTARQAFIADSIISSFEVEYCCGTSLKNCINKKDVCPIANHLYNFILWLVQYDNDRSKIYDQLEKRYSGFIANKKYAIDTCHFCLL